MATKKDLAFDIHEDLEVLSESNTNDWSKRLRKVSWNNGGVKLDIRSWNGDSSRMSGGITLDDEEANRLCLKLIELGYGK